MPCYRKSGVKVLECSMSSYSQMCLKNMYREMLMFTYTISEYVEKIHAYDCWYYIDIELIMCTCSIS